MLSVGCAPSRSSATSVSATNWGETIFSPFLACLARAAIGLPNPTRRTKKPEPDSDRLDKPPLLRHEQRVLLLPRRELHLGPGERDLLLDVLDLDAVDARAAALDEPPRLALGLGKLGRDQGVDHGDGRVRNLDAR